MKSQKLIFLHQQFSSKIGAMIYDLMIRNCNFFLSIYEVKEESVRPEKKKKQKQKSNA